jgi:hypothetical protein
MENGNAGVRVVKVRTGLKAGGSWNNHNRRFLVTVRAGLKAGGMNINHNRRLLISVRTGVRAGGLWGNHNRRLVVLGARRRAQAVNEVV